MMGMGASGALLAISAGEWMSVLAGAATIYFVITAWLTLRRTGGVPGRLEVFMVGVATVLVLGYVATELWATRSGIRPEGIPAGVGYLFAGVALLAALGDVRLLRRGRISGAPRLARHLCRMCYAMLLASVSFFLGQMQLFPAAVQQSGALLVLAFLPLVAMAFWLPLTLWRRRPGRVAGTVEGPG
jgi:hypothetical protein